MSFIIWKEQVALRVSAAWFKQQSATKYPSSGRLKMIIGQKEGKFSFPKDYAFAFTPTQLGEFLTPKTDLKFKYNIGPSAYAPDMEPKQLGMDFTQTPEGTWQVTHRVINPSLEEVEYLVSIELQLGEYLALKEICRSSIPLLTGFLNSAHHETDDSF